MLNASVVFYNGLLTAGLVAPVVGVIFDTSVCDFHDCTPEVVGFLGPFLQSFASQHPSVSSLTIEIISTLVSSETLYALILSTSSCASGQVKEVAIKNGIMG